MKRLFVLVLFALSAPGLAGDQARTTRINDTLKSLEKLRASLEQHPR